jgi:hypothetical protein
MKVWVIMSWFMLFLVMYNPLRAQKTIFTENFENGKLGEAWHVVNGDWNVAEVSDLRIAPAENGYRYALRSGGSGFIRLIVDIPDTVKASSLQLEWSYYTFAKGSGLTVEGEFHKKIMSDGLRGKLWKMNLPIKGRWIQFKKVLQIPAGADSIYLVFSETKSKPGTKTYIGIDAVKITAL